MLKAKLKIFFSAYSIGEILLFLLAAVSALSFGLKNFFIFLNTVAVIFYLTKNRNNVQKIDPVNISKWYFLLILLWLSYIFLANNFLQFFTIVFYYAIAIMPIFFAYFFARSEVILQKIILYAATSCSLNALFVIYETFIMGARRSGGYMNILDFGILSGLLILALTIFILHPQGVHKKYSTILLFILMVGLVANNVRMVLLSTTICLFFILVFLSTSFSKKKLIFLSLGFLSIICIFILTSKRSFFNIEMTKDNFSNASRLIWWNYSLEIIRNNLLFGVGFDNLIVPDIDIKTMKILPAGLEGKPKTFGGSLHSSYLQLLALTGLVGFLSYLFFWYKVAVKLLIQNFSKNTSIWFYFLASTLIFYSFCALTDLIILKSNMYMFTFFVGIGIKGILLSTKTKLIK